MKIKIKSPRNKSAVSDKFQVRGTATEDVQLYVQAHDAKWYLQPATQRNKNKHSFKGQCYVGDLLTPDDSRFSVAALLTSERPASPVDTLPDAPMSKITVRLKKTQEECSDSDTGWPPA